MNDLLEILATKPNVRAAMTQALQAFGGRLVGNRVHNADEADLMHAAARLASDYLGISIPVLGAVEASTHLGDTRVSGRPLLVFEGAYPDARVADFDTDLTEEFLRAQARRRSAAVAALRRQPASQAPPASP